MCFWHSWLNNRDVGSCIHHFHSKTASFYQRTIIIVRDILHCWLEYQEPYIVGGSQALADDPGWNSFPASVVFFPGNHTAYGFTSEATREIDWQLSALETVPSITGLGSQWQFLFCKELVNHLLQLSDVGHSQELKWELVHL